MGPMSVIFFACLLHISTATVCPGCHKNKDINDPTLGSVLLNTLSQHPSLPEGTENEDVELVKLIKATTQVISGLRYTFEFEARGVESRRAYHCTLVLVTKVWKKEQAIEEYKCTPVSSSRTKRSVLGGPVALDVENNKYLQQLKEPISEELNKNLKQDYLYGVVKFYKATQQVVAGTLIKATAEVAPTKCAKGEKSPECLAKFQKEGRQLCEVEVWDQPWLNKRTVTVKDCNKIPQFCAGCPREISSDDVTANQCLQRALFNLNAKAKDSRKQFFLKKIVRVQSQVVAGIKYIVDFEAEDSSKKAYMCHVEVVSQPWVSEEPIVDEFNCNPLKTN